MSPGHGGPGCIGWSCCGGAGPEGCLMDQKAQVLEF